MAPRAKKKAADAATGLHALAIDKLASSGLSPEDGRQLGMVERRGSDLSPELQDVVLLHIPYFDTDGSDTGFYRVRYLEAPTGFAGQVEKPQRYAQLKDTLNHVYLPRLEGLDWEAIASDATEPLIITEGELKAACACRHGFTTIALGGVTVWQSSKKQVPLLPPLDKFNWKNRSVTVVFDSDAATNPDVARAQVSLAAMLLKLGAAVKVGVLPGSGKKTGLDDFLVAGGDLGLVVQEARSTDLARHLVAMNGDYIFVADQDVAMRVDRDLRYKRDALINGVLANHRVVEYRMTAKGNQVRTEVSVPQEWLKWPTRRTVSSLVYEPGRGKFIGDDYNIWKGWGCEPSAGDVGPWAKLLDFLFDGSPAERAWFERWCACPLQQPGTKMYAAAVLWGPDRGTGKSLVGTTLGRIYGSNYAAIGNKDLHNHFNEWAVGKQFVLGDEITGSDRRNEADDLKQLITQEWLRINMKHLPTYTVRDCLNYYFTSNHPDAFFIDDQERRYFIHRVPKAALPRDFYKGFVAWLNGQGKQALFHHLLHLDMGDFDPAAHAPVTASKLEMVDHSKSDLSAFVSNLMRNQDAELQRFADLFYLKEVPDLVLNKHLRHLYDPDNALRVTANGLGRELSRYGVKTLPPVGTKVFGVQRFYVLRNVRAWLDAKPSDVAAYVDKVYQPMAKKGKR